MSHPSLPTSSTKCKKGKRFHHQSLNLTNNERVSGQTNISLSDIINKIQRPLDCTVASEYSLGSVSYVYKRERSLNMLLLDEQNRSYPENCTDIVFHCSNGYIRAHSLLMMSSSLIVRTLKEQHEGQGNDNDKGNRCIAVNGYKVENIAKILFLFYAGQVIFTMDNEKKIILRLLEVFGVKSTAIAVVVPFSYSDDYKQLLQQEMQGLQLRMTMKTTKTDRNEKGEDEYFIQPNGSMEPLDKEGDCSDVIIPEDEDEGFYCAVCQCTFAGNENLETHTLEVHQIQIDRSRNYRRMRTAQLQSEMQVSTTTVTDPDQPGTSAAARKQLQLSRAIPATGIPTVKQRAGTQVNKTKTKPANGDDLHLRIILPPTVTSTPNAPLRCPSRRIRPFSPQELGQQNQKYFCCGVCSLVLESDEAMTTHLQHYHSRTVDENEKHLDLQCKADNPNSFEGTRCLICDYKYLTAFALKVHYEKFHDVNESEHYTLSVNPECLVCKQKIGYNHRDGENATQFFYHVRRCLTGQNQANMAGQASGGNSLTAPRRKPKVPKWSTAKRMETVVAEVLKTPLSTKRKYPVKRIPEKVATLSKQPAPQIQIKKNNLGPNQQPQPTERSTIPISTEPGRVLRPRKKMPEVPEKNKKASKIPKIQLPRTSILPKVVVSQELISQPQITNVSSIPKIKQKAAPGKSHKQNIFPVKRKTANTGTQKNKKVELKKSKENEGRDHSIFVVPIDDNSRVRGLEIANRGDEDKENAGNNENLLGMGTKKSLADRLSTASGFQGTPNYHSTKIFDLPNLSKENITVHVSRVPVIRLGNLGEINSNVDERVCNAADETFTTEVVADTPLEPEVQRSGPSSLYMTPEQSLQIPTVSDKNISNQINNSEIDNFKGFSDTSFAKINGAVNDQFHLIQNEQYSLHLQDGTNLSDTNLLEDFPADIATIFL